MKSLFKLYFVLVSCLLLGLSLAVFAAEVCVRCHQEVKEQGRRQRVVHQPFLRGTCSQCHIAGQALPQQQKKISLQEEKEQLKQLRWFWTSPGRLAEHWIRLPAEQVSGVLFLNASDGSKRLPLQQIALPRQAVPQLPVDQQSPVQSELRVSGVRRGISATATLQWETDEQTESEIRYGVGNLRSRKTINQLARSHTETLLGLDSDQDYQFQVASYDLSGNETLSPVLQFSTDKSFWNQDVIYSTRSRLPSEIKLNWEFSRLQTGFLLKVIADRPVSLSLGSRSAEQNNIFSERKVAANTGYSHPVLKGSLDTNVAVCLACHQEVRLEYSHPIRVAARQGMVIPSEYSLLPDGTISCMTCHIPHASKNPARILKEKKSDLCRGCHQDY